VNEEALAHWGLSYQKKKIYEIWDSVFCVMTRLRATKFEPEQRQNFLSFSRPRTVLEPSQPLMQWITRLLSQGAERPVHEFDRSPLSDVEVKNEWSYFSNPLRSFLPRTETN